MADAIEMAEPKVGDLPVEVIADADSTREEAPGQATRVAEATERVDASNGGAGNDDAVVDEVGVVYLRGVGHV